MTGLPIEHRRHPRTQEDCGQASTGLDAGKLRSASPWRQRLAERHMLNLAYRWLVGVIGTLVVIVGLIAVPLPGPGWATVILGLIVLATEFPWAQRQLSFTRRQMSRWSCWARRQPVWSRLLLTAGTASFTYLILAVTLRVLGIPEWVPDWVPLWR